jgi:hypothetical protein
LKAALLLMALALASCGPQQQAQQHCDLSFEREIAFTAPDAQDRIIVRTLGESCDKAIGHYAVLSHDGHPLWAWTEPLPRGFGDAFREADAEQMRAFLERWSLAQISTTDSAPPWARLAEGQSTLDRLTYDDIRSRHLPMLCHVSGTSRETCVFWEPAAASAGHFYDRALDEALEGET